MTSPTPAPHVAMAQTVQGFLAESGLEWELGARPEEYVVSLPGERKLKTVCSLVVSDRDLSVSAFVVRNPDENHAEVYRWLLRRNLRLPYLSYAVDASGDVYVTGRVPAAAVSADLVDQVLGIVLEAADQPFNDILVLGFLTSMKKEWAWRVDRGEPLTNLEAFRHLLERPGDPGTDPDAVCPVR